MKENMANANANAVAITCIALLLSLSSVAAAPRRSPFNTIYAFGDSFTDTGNTHSNAGPAGFMFVSNPPYGQTFFHRPTNRYTDGRLVIDFVAQALSLPFLPPYLHTKTDRTSSAAGVNFAVAGSTAIVHSFFVKNNMTLNITPQSIHTQLTWFEEFLTSKCGDSAEAQRCRAGLFEDSLIWAGEIGANDYAYSFGSSIPTETITKLAVNSVTGFLQAILEKGAKYLVVQGLPPTGCLTLSLYLAPPKDRDSYGCVASVNNHTVAHNSALKTRITELRRKFPGATIVYADYYEAYMAVMKNPAAYGIKELYAVCCGHGGGKLNFDFFNVCGSKSSTACGAPSQYVNWDGVHLTEAMYRATAAAFLDGSRTQPPLPALFNRRH